jgi:hypothetical protein
MNIMKALWAVVMGSPRALMHSNMVLAVAWLFMVPLWWLTDLRYSVAFIGAASIYANFTGHLATWQAARVEVKQEQDRERGDKINN